MTTWLSRRPVVLDELIRRDGLQGRGFLPRCAGCLEESGAYKCLDCTAHILYCATCIIFRHEELPLHCIEVWRHFLERTFLISFRSGTEDSSSGHPSKT